MSIDTALQLKKFELEHINVSDKDIDNYLEQSKIVNKLVSEFQPKTMFIIWRLIALSEIPFSYRLSYTKKVVKFVEDHLACEVGFTLNGKADNMLPCYNAMIIEAFCKLGLSDHASVKAGIEWIKRYQVFDRETKTTWKGKGIQKYGGCFKSVPCFIGIAKNVKAIAYYNHVTKMKDAMLIQLEKKGMEYVLNHHLYQRLSNGMPINNHILLLSYPASYQLNIIELFELAWLTKTMDDERCKEAKEYVAQKQIASKEWKIDYAYRASGYMTFDQKGKKAEWVSYLLSTFLSDKKTKELTKL